MATTLTMTGAEYDALPYEESRRFELIDGELIPVGSQTVDHQELVFRILMALREYLKTHRVEGLALTDVEFALEPDCRMRPDVFVLLDERARSLNKRKVPVPGAPDIAVEVASASETRPQRLRKAAVYLSNGVREVWRVTPETASVTIMRADRDDDLHFGEGSTLESGLLPGFRMDVGALFAE